MQQFYIAREGEAFGPLSTEDTNRMVLEGALDRSTLVWDGNRHDWIDASVHPIISRIFDRHLMDDVESEAALITRQAVFDSPATQAADQADAALREGCEGLQTEYAALQANIERAREQFAEFERAGEASARRNEELARSLSETESLARAATASADEATALLEERRAALTALEAETARRRAAEAERARAAESATREAEAILEAARLAQAELEAELQSRRRDMEKVKSERCAGEERLLAMREEVERLGRAASASRAAGEEAEKTLGRLRAETATAGVTRDAITREINAACRDRDVLRKETEALETRRSAYDAEIALVNDRLAAICGETAALEEKRLEAEALLGREVHAAFDEIRAAVGELGRLTSAWSEFKTADEAHRREGLGMIDELTRRIREREAELAEVFARLGDRARIDGERALAETARDEAVQRAGELKEELKSLTVLCWEELQSLEKAREERTRIAAEIESWREKSASTAIRQEKLIDEVSGLVGRRASLELECAALDETLKALERERAARESELVDMRQRRERLAETVREAEIETTAVAAESARRQEEIAVATARLAELERTIVGRRDEFEAENARLIGMRDAAVAAAEKATMEFETRFAARQAEAAREMDAAETRLAALKNEAERFIEEDERRRLTAAEERRAVEAEFESARRTLADLHARREAAAAELEAREMRRGGLDAELLRLEEETRRLEARRAVAETILEEASTRLAESETRRAEHQTLLGRLREEEGERTGRLDRLAAESARLENECARNSEELRGLAERAAAATAELATLEKERTARGLAELKDLRELLRLRERKEQENLDKMLLEARAEFKQLQDDWRNEERGGATNEELRRTREEVEERRRELIKAERQLAAMRAGLAKLREENGRGLLQRAQAFEVQQLEELRRRIAESRTETETLENAWAGEMKSAELVDRQWFEIRSRLDK